MMSSSVARFDNSIFTYGHATNFFAPFRTIIRISGSFLRLGVNSNTIQKRYGDVMEGESEIKISMRHVETYFYQ